jgi:UDP:flavonoid glycosyltransferase YjiC (YdhE family)
LKVPEISNFNRSGKKPIVLVSPLDWGLGHTTRCIPIIQELLNHNCQVIIACNSMQNALLSTEFPQCTYVNLQGYDMRYGSSRWSTLGRILRQLPKILTKINNENRWLNNFLQKQAVDAVISDNRFGLHHHSIPCVFITHQLEIKTGLGSLTDRMAQWLNYRRIARFNTCWVPDFKGPQAMAGQLSNPGKMPGLPVHYLGGLSRLQPCDQLSQSKKLLIILSGPEPQRSLFENLLLQQLERLPVQAVLVRGLPGTAFSFSTGSHLTVYDHAPASQLNQLICDADCIISRSGYTTVMDLLKLGKKSILVPTPGQAEQEYLADYLHAQQLAYTERQPGFSLENALAAARQFNYKQQTGNMSAYKAVIGEWLQTIT